MPRKPFGDRVRAMPAGLNIAIALFAQAATVEAPPAATAGTAPEQGSEGCRTPLPTADATEIVVCAERPQGYRIDPDVRTARRQARSSRPTRSTAHMRDSNCASVGPMGCTGYAGINLLGAALTAVEMATRAARGENVGEMFVTDPQASEYELYLAAKRKREAEEAEAAAKARAKAKATAAEPGKAQ